MHREGVQCTGAQVTRDDSRRASLHDEHVEDLVAHPQLDPPQPHLTHEGRGRGHLELLARLATRVVSARDLDAPEGTGRQGAPVLAGEGHPQGVEVVDDTGGLLAEAPRLRLPRTEVSALDGVRDEPGQRVSVHASGPCSVDAALGRDRVRATGCVVGGDGNHVEAELRQ